MRFDTFERLFSDFFKKQFSETKKHKLTRFVYFCTKIEIYF